MALTDRYAAQDLHVGDVVYIEQGRVYSSYTPKPSAAVVTRRTKTLVEVIVSSGSEYKFRWNATRDRWLAADSVADIYERNVLITAETGRDSTARIERSDKIDTLRAQARGEARKLTESRYPSVTTIDEVIDALQVIRAALAETEAL